jgi:hypothetical protein
MKQILLVDFTRSFLDSRPAIVSRSSKDAIRNLHKFEGKIGAIWMDYRLGPADDIKPLLDYLILRAKIGSKYPVNVIFVHSPDEASWQILNAKLGNAGYRIERATVRDTLG